ncbi:sigma-E factor regulatory protein RseB domain-containing protein [Nocardiopsis potens]|uniref:sigma-E factor regulatory protein RseB domain-containing protein n=1 Tax=Nocardiopsis potens TaxID=1246458 RepID=UPI001267F2EE|nr:sigma-E factor regulatory protein RseB domain-containing protein [Nocardiopsis potens]
MVTGRDGAPWPCGGDRSRYDGSTALLALCCALLLALTLTASSGPGSGQGPAGGADDGMDLLRRAADASRKVSYQGVQAISSTGPAGTEHRVVEVEHSAETGTRFHEPGGAGGMRLRPAASSEWPDPGARVLDALEENYRVVRAGAGEVSGRPAELVEALRADGGAAGRFWIDGETGLPLRRMTLDPLGRVVHFSEFTEFRVVDAAAGAAGDGRSPDPWGDRLDQGELRELRADGWTAPDRLSWNYRLMDARTKRKPSGPVVHLSYSDGLSVISVFVERGRLGPGSGGTGQGMRAVEGGGGTVYMGGAGQQRRMWESEEYVYTMLADAPADAVAAAAASLPGPDEVGFWDRVDRGFARFGDWFGI